MSDEPERKPERKGRQIDAFLEELKTRQAGEPQLPIKGSYPDGDRSTTNLYVGNISPATTEAQLAKIFARYGQLESVKIMWPRTDEERRRGRNCGFVQYSKRQDACAAKDSLDGEYVDGKRIKVGWGKAVPEARVPQPAGPSLSDLAAEAQARAKQVLMKATGMTPMKDCDARISVVIPADPEQKILRTDSRRLLSRTRVSRMSYGSGRRRTRYLVSCGGNHWCKRTTDVGSGRCSWGRAAPSPSAWRTRGPSGCLLVRNGLAVRRRSRLKKEKKNL